MLLSIIIPTRNEERCIFDTVEHLRCILDKNSVNFEIIIVDDSSSDRTEEIVKKIAKIDKRVYYVMNTAPHGFGLAVKKGLELYHGDAAAIVMADGSDNPQDVVGYYKKLQQGYDCIFGSRFIKNSQVKNYPIIKLILNRFANLFIRILFNIQHNDITNAFKCYRREVICGIKPLLAQSFNLTVELPLKAIIMGYSYAIIPIDWNGREKGITKFKIREVGSGYTFIIFYLLLKKYFSKNSCAKSRKDYVRL